MRLLIALLFINCCLFATEVNKKKCMDVAGTQLEMNQCAQNILKNADIELTKVYHSIKEKYKHDSVFINKLVIAQRTWIKYRDAQIDMIYPHSTDHLYYGSVFPMCKSLKLAELTTERTKVLMQWLTGMSGGNGCNGSIE